MNIAFATLQYSARDITRGSGTFYHMSREIERQGHVVYYLGPIPLRLPLISRVLRYAHRKMARRQPAYLDPFVGRLTGQEVGRQLARLEYDVLLTNDFSIAGYTQTRKPIVIYTDMMITPDFQERFIPSSKLSNLSPLSLHLARRVLKAGLHRAHLCVFPARWSADAACKYGCPPNKIVVIPFGANVEDPGASVSKARDLGEQARQKAIKLLFVGKDWARKGGATAVEATRTLVEREVSAHLHVVGEMPPGIDVDYVCLHGLLDKRIESDRQKLDQLYRDCDVLLLPTRREGSVIVPLEAAAYGMPTIAYDAVGVTPSVKAGESGVLLPPGVPAEAFAEVIMGWFADPAQYNRLAAGARRHFEATANWPRSVSLLMAEIEKLVAGDAVC